MASSQVPVHTFTLDMRDLAAVARLPHELPDGFKDIDILVNNAGLALGVTTVSDHDIEVSVRWCSKHCQRVGSRAATVCLLVAEELLEQLTQAAHMLWCRTCGYRNPTYPCILWAMQACGDNKAPVLAPMTTWTHLS